MLKVDNDLQLPHLHEYWRVVATQTTTSKSVTNDEKEVVTWSMKYTMQAKRAGSFTFDERMIVGLDGKISVDPVTIRISD